MHRYRLKGEIEDKRREGIPSIEMKVDLRQHVKPEGRKFFLHSAQPEGRKCFLHSAQPEGKESVFCTLHNPRVESVFCTLQKNGPELLIFQNFLKLLMVSIFKNIELNIQVIIVKSVN